MTKETFKHTVFSLSSDLLPMVSRMLGNTAVAEDVIQDIMIKLWIKRDQIQKHPNIPGLVFLTARNHCIDLMRKKKICIYDAPFVLDIAMAKTDQDQLEWTELVTIIRKVLKSLPEQQAEVLLLRDLDGYEFTEIAAVTKLNIEHVRVLLSRARKKLSLQLEKIYSYERR